MIVFNKQQFGDMISSDKSLLRESIIRLVSNDHKSVIEGLPEDLLHEMIDGGIDAASRFQLTEPSDIAAFVLIMFEVGPEFYRHPVIHAHLTDTSVPPNKRLDAVIERTPHSVWSDIEANIHLQTWFPELPEEAKN
ncbi:MAG TPA: hypothetical protein PKZ97_05105 [Azospirillaceae bacterium]|nr:hypothetical protein [Azospirillaceae bacterium]